MVRSMGAAISGTRRPAAVLVTAGVLVLLGVSALLGGMAMLTGGAPPEGWLDDIPMIDSWVVPGLVLAVGFGAGSLVTAYGVLRRPRWAWLEPVERGVGQHWSWLATTVLGLGQVVWIALELVFLPESSFLQAGYALVGLVLLLLPLSPRVRDDLARPAGLHDRVLRP
jgi:hypothetical protein